MFTLLMRIDDSSQWVRPTNSVMDSSWDNPADCAAFAKQLNAESKAYGRSVRYRVHKIPPADLDAWQARENAKFTSGEYQPVPWAGLPWTDKIDDMHYCHISKSKSGFVSYTESSIKGMDDIQTRMRPGKYLHRFFGNIISGAQIAAYCSELGVIIGDSVLMFAKTSDHVENVFLNGPSSCMSHSVSDYSVSIHPTRVYGDSPDLQLAYMERQEINDESPRIVARCIVWPDKMRHSEIYGDDYRMGSLLHNTGYEPGSMHGARIRLINDDGNRNRIVMPYIDGPGACSYSDDSRYLLIDSCGDIGACGTEGYAYTGQYCPCCENRSNSTFHHINDVDENWCNRCYESRVFYCDSCNEDFSSNNTVSHRVSGALYCQECYDESYVDCADCGEETNNDSIHHSDDGMICDSCHANLEDSQESLELTESEDS